MTDTSPTYAIVKEPFDGCRDGEFQPVSFVAGDALEGDIAAAGIAMGKASACTAEDFREARAAAAAAPEPDAPPTLESVIAHNNRLRMALDDANAGRMEAEAERAAADKRAAELAEALAAAQAEIAALKSAAAAKA